MTRVKVCGITRESDLDAAVAAGADAVGVITEVSVDSPREVSPEQARELVAAAPPFTTTVLVTMARTPNHITELVETVKPDAVQVHADLPPARVARLSADLAAVVIPVVDAAETTLARRHNEVVHAMVVDSLSPDRAGGTGKTHDWDRTREVVSALTVPVILAGGLTPANVSEAVQTVEPYAVDVASGVERAGGIKDHDAVRSFVARAKAVGTQPRDPSVLDAGSEADS